MVPAGIGPKEYKTNSMTDKDKINDTDFEVDADDLEYIDYNFPEIDFSNGGYTINLGPVDQYDPPKQQELFRQYIMSQWLHSSHLADENPQWQVESYIKNKPLPVVKPGTQTRRFTHIYDTIEVCYKAWKNRKCKYYSISNKKSYSIMQVAKLFKTKIKYLPERKGERFASALTNMSLSNKVHKSFGTINLEDYIENFLNSQKKT